MVRIWECYEKWLKIGLLIFMSLILFVVTISLGMVLVSSLKISAKNLDLIRAFFIVFIVVDALSLPWVIIKTILIIKNRILGETVNSFRNVTKKDQKVRR